MEQQVSNISISLSVPLMHKERFAELVGVSYGVVDGWVERGYVPSVVIGKHKLVNLVLLTQECLENLPR